MKFENIKAEYLNSKLFNNMLNFQIQKIPNNYETRVDDTRKPIADKLSLDNKTKVRHYIIP